MDKKCKSCYARCEEQGCPRSHNQYGCMGCGCEEPWGEHPSADWCYCYLCDPVEED